MSQVSTNIDPFQPRVQANELEFSYSYFSKTTAKVTLFAAASFVVLASALYLSPQGAAIASAVAIIVATVGYRGANNLSAVFPEKISTNASLKYEAPNKTATTGIALAFDESKNEFLAEIKASKEEERNLKNWGLNVEQIRLDLFKITSKLGKSYKFNEENFPIGDESFSRVYTQLNMLTEESKLETVKELIEKASKTYGSLINEFHDKLHTLKKKGRLKERGKIIGEEFRYLQSKVDEIQKGLGKISVQLERAKLNLN